MEKLKEERKELSKLKQYSTGWAFSEFVDKIHQNIFNKIKSEHRDFALGMQKAYKKQYENDFLDIIFLKDHRYLPIWHEEGNDFGLCHFSPHGIFFILHCNFRSFLQQIIVK